MSFELSSALLLGFLAIKELAGSSRSRFARRAAMFLYLIILPLLGVFVINAVARVNQQLV